MKISASIYSNNDRSLEILIQDLDKYNVDIIVSEITDTNLKDLEIYNLSLENILKSNLYKLMTEKEYKLINWVNADLIFIKKTSKL